jgi:sigma-B regulation protein RsbU (phosphoserine phosphatase)
MKSLEMPLSLPVPSDRLRILVVDDDVMTRVTLESVIRGAGWSPIAIDDPELACQILTGPDAPPIALIDWQMPSLSGIELCRRVRAADGTARRPYLIFVTANSTSTDIVTGLDAGADGYMTKPIAADELQARVRAGLRTIALQQELMTRVQEAEAESARTRPLRELLPICCYCRRIRDERQQWSSLEEYLTQRIDVQFTHGFCPSCYEQHVLPDLEGGE